MGSSDSSEYCAFTKAVEYLGDRWSLLIVRELAQFGPQGFNALATGLPGRISRSVLRDRLRMLEEVGLIDAAARSWLLVARGTEPRLCLEDPSLSAERYVYVEADAADLFPVAHGDRSWADALHDGSVRVYGEPEQVAAFPGWFLGAERGGAAG